MNKLRHLLLAGAATIALGGGPAHADMLGAGSSGGSLTPPTIGTSGATGTEANRVPTEPDRAKGSSSGIGAGSVSSSGSATNADMSGGGGLNTPLGGANAGVSAGASVSTPDAADTTGSVPNVVGTARSKGASIDRTIDSTVNSTVDSVSAPLGGLGAGSSGASGGASVSGGTGQ